MLRNSLLLILGLCCLLAQASADLFDNANEAYTAGEFDKATALYDSILKQGNYSWELQFNLGNCHYQLNNVPEAVLHFEKALKLNPGEEDILINLELANARCVDKNSIDKSIRISAWVSQLLGFAPNAWAWTAIFCFALSMTCFAAFYYNSNGKLKRLMFVVGVFMLLPTAVSFALSAMQTKTIVQSNYAIVFTPSVTLKSSPSEQSSNAFVLHEGSKIFIRNQENDWLEVQFSDGKVGWIQKVDVKFI